MPLLPEGKELADAHGRIAARGSGLTLASAHPAAGAVLRCLLASDPVAGFIIEGLTGTGPGKPVPMSDLVRAAAARDRALTPVIFFKPEAVPQITDKLGGAAARDCSPGDDVWELLP